MGTVSDDSGEGGGDCLGMGRGFLSDGCGW